MKFICPLCGEVYDEEDSGMAFADLPEEWRCPLCFAPKSSFRPEQAPEPAEPPAGTLPRTGSSV